MQYPGYNTGKVILTEGEWYPFKIHNLVQLQDDAYYYVMLDINGLKHFMPAEYYLQYEFNIGDDIDCKIDRINCTGRIFLEPKHPFYKEGEIYAFTLLNYQNHGNESILFVKGINENSIEVRINDQNKICLANVKKVNCKVKGTKKGSLILEYLDISN
jgi:hypothetical protein